MATSPSIPTVAANDLVEVTVSLPADVVREIDRLAAEKGYSRSFMFTAAARNYVFDEERWREVQAIFSRAAQDAGLREEDIEDYLDSLPEPEK